MARPKSSPRAATQGRAKRRARAGERPDTARPGAIEGKAAAGVMPKRGTALPATAQSKAPSGVAAKSKTSMPSYLSVYRASPLERIFLINQGVRAGDAKRLFADVPIGQGAGFKALNLPTATVNRKAKQGDVLSREEGERVVGFARLVGQLEAMIEESGEPAGFDSRTWLARWLTEPLPAFGGACPADLMDTMEGQALVSSALAMVQSGAYS